MIQKTKLLSLAETLEYLKGTDEKSIDIKSFIKKFAKISPEKAKQLRKKIEELDLMKIKEEHITKFIDLLPTNTGELNKIFTDVSLNEDETKKILETIKEYN